MLQDIGLPGNQPNDEWKNQWAQRKNEEVQQAAVAAANAQAQQQPAQQNPVPANVNSGGLPTKIFDYAKPEYQQTFQDLGMIVKPTEGGLTYGRLKITSNGVSIPDVRNVTDCDRAVKALFVAQCLARGKTKDQINEYLDAIKKGEPLPADAPRLMVTVNVESSKNANTQSNIDDGRRQLSKLLQKYGMTEQAKQPKQETNEAREEMQQVRENAQQPAPEQEQLQGNNVQPQEGDEPTAPAPP